ncbi:MAG: hypothetical protein ACRDZ2_15810, partial [Ilumatobacteraceae bacterium]
MQRFRTSDWLIIGGGAVMLIFGLALKWVTVPDFGSAGNPFDFFFTGGLAWLLTVAAGVLAFLLASNTMRAGTTPWPLVLLGMTGLATLLMLIRLLLGPGADIAGRGPGMWVSFIAAAVALAGSVMRFTEAGGNLGDLTDVDKLRDAFDRPDTATTPPPPPPVATTRPPPPPPAPGPTPPPPPP